MAEGEGRVHTAALPPGDRSPSIVTARAIEFFRAHREALGLGDPSFEMRQKVVVPDWLDMDHVRYQRTYQQVPVFGSELIVHLDSDGDVQVVNGRVVPEIDLDPIPRLSAQQAVELAVEAFRATPPGGPVFDMLSPCGAAAAEACGTVDCGAGCGRCASEKRPPSPFREHPHHQPTLSCRSAGRV
jgi:hypothetical protein